MWYAFLQAFQLLQKINATRVIFDSEEKQFVENPKTSPKYWFTNSQVIQVSVISFLRMMHYLRSEKGKSGLTFVDFAVDLLVFTLTVMQMCCCFSFYKRRHCVVWFLNQYMAGADNVEDKTLGVMTIMLYSLVGICLTFPFALGALPVIFSNTAVHQILKFWLPAFIMSNKILEMVICGIYYMALVFFAVIPVLTTLLTTLMLVVEGGESLKSAFSEGEKPQANKKASYKKGQTVNKVVLRFSRAVKTYKKAYLLWEFGMQFGYLFYPMLILCAYVINVVTTFACIKLYSELPPIMVALFALIDVLVLANTVAFNAFALVIAFDFEKFFWFWKTHLMKRRNRRILMACMPIRVKVGSFFPLRESTVMATMDEIVNMTVTLLLA